MDDPSNPRRDEDHSSTVRLPAQSQTRGRRAGRFAACARHCARTSRVARACLTARKTALADVTALGEEDEFNVACDTQFLLDQ
jgi:hypothetical protein